MKFQNYLAFGAEQAGLSLTWLQNPKDRFFHDEAQLLCSHFSSFLFVDFIILLLLLFDKSRRCCLFLNTYIIIIAFGLGMRCRLIT